MQPECVVGVGVLLLGLLLAVAFVSFKNTLVGGAGRKVSLVSLGLFIGTLACIAVLNNAKPLEPRSAFLLTCFAIIPTCVVVASMFAVSFLEPLLMASGLFLIPFLGDFMPNVSGPRNLWRTRPLAEFGPVFNLLLLTTVYVVPLAIIGFGVLYASRKVRARQWTWGVLRGLALGLLCGVGVMFAVKRKMALDIAFGGDYTMVWVILGTFVAVTGLAGLKRNPHAVPTASEPAGRADGGAPLGSATQQGTTEIAAADHRSGGAATQSAPDRPIVHKRRMVSGAKCGLILLCLYVIFMGLVVVQPEPVRHIFRRMPDALGYALMFGLPILIGIAGLITGIQKKRPGIGVLALLTTPIGFFFALAAENRSSFGASSSAGLHKSPIGVTAVGSTLVVLSAFRLLTTFVPITANNHIVRMLSMSLMPVDPGDVYWMVSAFHLWPFSFLGGRAAGYGCLIVTVLIGVFLLRGIRLVRWLYLGWGALGILAALTSLYFPPGYIIIRALIYVAFTMVLLRKSSSDFFSRRQRPLSASTEANTTRPAGIATHKEPEPTLATSRKPVVNILGLRIIAERTSACALPHTTNMVLNAPAGLLQRAAQEMNLGRHLTDYSASHPPASEIAPEFSSDSERRRYFEAMCSVPTWSCYYEHGGLGFRYNVIVELDEKTYRAAEAAKQQGMPIEMALIDPDDLRKAFKR